MKAICLIVWMLISLILALSVIGLILFAPKDLYENADDVPSTWCTIGLELLESVINS